MKNRLIIVTVLALLLATSLASVSFGFSASSTSYGCTATPHITSLTRITSITTERLVITGSNFCSSAPLWDTLGTNNWLSSEGKGCGGTYNLPTIQVTDTTAHWVAGRETCSTVDNFGLRGSSSSNAPSWSNTRVVFYGVAGSPHWKVGDHIQIEIWSCNQGCHTTYATTIK
jgi:hypothetical protein